MTTITGEPVSIIGPFPTDYSLAPDCTNIVSEAVLGVDFASTCLPDDFDRATTAYYSPGTACPTGYTAQDSCTRSSKNATTITCCPKRGQITLFCVDDSATLTDEWAEMLCTWIVGDNREVIHTVVSTMSDVVVTKTVLMKGSDGLNAYGLRMIYDSGDLATTTTTSSATSTTTNSNSSDEGGISTGAIVAIAVVIPVVAIAILIGIFFWYRRRKQRHGPNDITSKSDKHPPTTTTGSHQPSVLPPESSAPSELYASPRTPQELPTQALSELPAAVPERD